MALYHLLKKNICSPCWIHLELSSLTWQLECEAILCPGNIEKPQSFREIKCMSEARSGGDMHKAKNLWGNLQGRRKHCVSHTQEWMEGRNEGAGINPNSSWDSWNTNFSGKGLFGTWMSLNTSASSELYALLSPQISTEGMHRFCAEFLQPDSAPQSRLQGKHSLQQ